MKKSKFQQASDKDSALEIIELASADFESLARAFNLIAEVCVASDISGESSSKETLLH